MNLLLIAHILASLFTLVFAVYTGFHIFHRYSFQHRVELMSKRMAPLIISRQTKMQITNTLVKEGYVEAEISELYDKLSKNFTPQRQK